MKVNGEILFTLISRFHLQVITNYFKQEVNDDLRVCMDESDLALSPNPCDHSIFIRISYD